LTKAVGDISVTWQPMSTPCNAEMRPMSWNSGSQVATRSRSSTSHRSRMLAMLCSTLPWLSATPFGEPVDPDEYWRYASDCAPTAGRRQSRACPLSTVSMATLAGPAGKPASSSVVETTTTGPALRAMPALRRADTEPAGPASGGAVGTATRPA
jgi:hypothetical protein